MKCIFQVVQTKPTAVYIVEYYRHALNRPTRNDNVLMDFVTKQTVKYKVPLRITTTNLDKKDIGLPRRRLIQINTTNKSNKHKLKFAKKCLENLFRPIIYLRAL